MEDDVSSERLPPKDKLEDTPGTATLNRLSLLQNVSFKIVGSLESFYYNWGYFIGSKPAIPIISCFVITILCGIGLITFTPENRPDKLWIPWNSEFVKDTDWLNSNFPSPFRFHYVIITADDVLQPGVFNVLLDIHNGVKNLEEPKYRKKWNDLCFRLPVIKFDNKSPKKKREIKSNKTQGTISSDFDLSFDDDEGLTDSDKPFDPSVDLPVSLYCEILSGLDEECYETNPMELWNYNDTGMKSKEDILEKINHPQISPVFGRPVDYSMELGLVTRNASGYIISAQSVMLRYYARLNRTAMDNGEGVTDEGTGQSVDKYNFEWEGQLAKMFLKYEPPPGIDIYFNVARSFADISGTTIWNDAYKFGAGFSIVFMYVIFMLGKFNFVEQRPFLSLAGLACVALAIICSYGISSAFRIIYGPVHNILPFLLMGLGIDDMFVIMQCYNNLKTEDLKKSIPERLGLTLKHAGVSITVTSLTDFFAFAIGATTVLPALQSFCIYAALGIVFVFVFQATFFSAWLAIDQMRIETKRNAFFPWIIHPSFSPKSWTTTSFAQNVIDKMYCRFLFNNITKIFVILGTLTILGINIWGNILLRQEFNPIWFLPQDSYLFQYFAARDKYFPDKGKEGFVIMNEVDIPSNLENFDRLVGTLNNFTFVKELDGWYSPFKTYVNSNFGKDIPNESLTEKELRKYLGKFLWSPSGGKYQASFKFEGNLTCGKAAPPISVSSLNFVFNVFGDPDLHVPAMKKIKKALSTANFTPKTSHSFIWSMAFASWETDEIITAELYRNMGLAMVCVFITTLVLIANFRTCLMVLLCVVFTLVDVGGSMHFWNLTIDTVSCIDLVLAIGLCVDYAAHIGHAFMTCLGTREERARKALVKIGAAVMNGGFSTFLAFILLANSRSHVFITFFKIFFLVVLYGLYHGLVFLPVLLSLMGPDPYATVLAAETEKARNAYDEPLKEAQMLLLNRPETKEKTMNRKPSLAQPEMDDVEVDNERKEIA